MDDAPPPPGKVCAPVTAESVTGAGSLGLLFPPCLPLILFAIWAKGVEVKQIFLAGILPGCVMFAVTAALGANGQVRLSWTSNASNFIVQRRQTLLDAWTPVSETIAKSIDIDPTGRTAFYRVLVK